MQIGNVINSQWTKHYRYIYHTTGFDPTYCSKTKYCMQQSVAQVTAGCNKQNVVFNNGLLELQPAVMLQFCNITAGCYLNHWLLHTIFCLLSVCWIKINSMIYIPIMFCPLTVNVFLRSATFNLLTSIIPFIHFKHSHS